MSKLTFKNFRIKKGRHRSISYLEYLFKFPITKRKVFNYNLMFTSFCYYTEKDLKNKINFRDINKAVGVGSLFHFHHNESVRFGWRPSLTKNYISLFVYGYVNGNRYYIFLEDFPVNKTIKATIDIKNYCVTVSSKDKDRVIDINKTKFKKLIKTPFLYKLYPYFGGDEKAPHDIIISCEDIETSEKKLMKVIAFIVWSAILSLILLIFWYFKI